MTEIKSEERPCRRVLANLDAYVDSALLTETSLELVDHFHRCAPCAREAEARRRMRERLQAAVREVPIPSGLEGRIRHSLRSGRSSSSRSRTAMAIAALLALCFGSLIAYQLGELRLTAGAQESYVVSISNRVAAMMRVGLGDHLHCTVFGKFPDNAPPLAELAGKLGSGFEGMAEALQAHVPGKMRLAEAHQCRYHGRRFTHLTFQDRGRLLSLSVSSKKPDESFAQDEPLPAVTHAGIPIYTAGVQNFQVAAFETRGFLVYAVSDLPPRRNLNVMMALAPVVKAYLQRIEG